MWNDALLKKEVREYVEENYRKDINRIVLKGSPFPEVNAQELATQLSGKKKVEKKLPTWFSNEKILFPPLLSLEQSSSETTAEYKASLVQGKTLIDLTGGYGVDAFYFSRKFEKVVYCEFNEKLSQLVAHNAHVLEVTNLEMHTGDGMEFLRRVPESFDWIYVDPSRRDDAGSRVFLLRDCLPNVPDNLELLFAKSSQILIKTSPLLDIQAGLNELEQVVEIHVVAVDNDVKELLWILRKDKSKSIKMKSVNFRKDHNHQFFSAVHGENPMISYSPPLAYLYEPNAAIMKSGLMNTLGSSLDLEKLHPNSHLFTSAEQKEFPGRRFRVIKTLPYHKKKLSRSLELKKAHITTRNFPLSVDLLRKQLKISEGGDEYLFFTTLEDGQKICIVCKKS